MRFIESLARWLEQFETIEERKTAYTFVRNRLIYVSSAEIANLVAASYPDVIRPFVIKGASLEKKVPEWRVAEIIDSPEFRILLRQSMFLGLSDGSRIDVFRRSSSPDISHEQILRTQEITEQRTKEMLQSLEEDLTIMLGRKPTEDEARFRIVFLLDDFSASGISYIRSEGGNSRYDGKIAGFYYDHCVGKHGKSGVSLIDPTEVRICLVLYMATNQACDHVKKLCLELFDGIPFEVKAVSLLDDSVRVNDRDDADFIKLLVKYYDPSIETKSYLIGRHTKPYLGFDECALPLVLGHNTPNNSVTLLWFPEGLKFRGLFPRISRFRE